MVFSLLNEGVDDAVTSWEVESAIEMYFKPLLENLMSFTNYTIVSQVQLLAALNLQVIHQEKEYLVREQDIPMFINSPDWNLATYSDLQPIHLIVYVPSSTSTPLRLANSQLLPRNETSIFVPQWGGLSILNIKRPKSHLQVEDIALSFETLARHLLILMGAPVTFQSSDIHTVLDHIQVQRIITNTRDSCEMLERLQRLKEEIDRMPITDIVANSISRSLTHLDKTLENLQVGDRNSAFQNAALALELCEQAFFHPTIISSLYHPEEHDWAVWSPLFAPLILPLALSILSEIVAYKKESSQKLKKT